MFRTAAIIVAAAAGLGFAPRAAHAQHTLTCESYRGRREVCRADTRGGVRLVDRLSDARCVEGRTWGYGRDAVWVSGGCRARFQVGGDTRYGRRGGDWNGRDGDWNGRGGDRDGRYGASQGRRICEQAVADRLGVRRSRIDAWDAGRSGSDRLYRWNGAGRQGTCRLDRGGRVQLRIGR